MSRLEPFASVKPPTIQPSKIKPLRQPPNPPLVEKPHRDPTPEFQQVTNFNKLIYSSIPDAVTPPPSPSKSFNDLKQRAGEFKTILSDILEYCKELEDENKTLKDRLYIT